MKTMKRLFCLSIAILLLCTSLTACAPQQEEVSELDLIKAEWQRYVVDRTVEITEVQLIGSVFDSNWKFIKGQDVIDEILDVLETLDVSVLRLWEDAPSESKMFLTSLNVTLIPQESNIGSISIHLKEDGEAYLNVLIGDVSYWVCVSGWNIYETIYEYK